MSGQNRAYVSMMGSRLLYTDMVSQLEYDIINISSSISWLATISGQKIQAVLEAQESALQEYDIDFDGEIDVNEAAKIMQERQKIEAQFEAQIDQIMAETQKAEKFEQQKKTLKEVMLENFRAWLDTVKEWLQQVDCSYMD